LGLAFAAGFFFAHVINGDHIDVSRLNLRSAMLPFIERRGPVKPVIFSYALYGKRPADLWVDFGFDDEGDIRNVYVDRNQDGKIHEIWEFTEGHHQLRIAVDRTGDGRIDGWFDVTKMAWNELDESNRHIADIMVRGRNEP